MANYNTYIQQLKFDGTTYAKGSVVDLLDKFKIVAMDFPFKKNPKPKDLPTRDWAGEDGLDVYTPDVLPMQSYDIDVTFLYVRNTADSQSVSGETKEQTRDRLMRQDINDFIDFIYGRKAGSDTENEVCSCRLAIWNDYVGMGRKDVVVSEVDNELFEADDCDPDAIAKFKVKFTVYDPTTEVTAMKGTYSGVELVTELNF